MDIPATAIMKNIPTSTPVPNHSYDAPSLSMAGLGHEFRTPLGALSAALEVISLAGSNTQVRSEACAVAVRQTRHLSQMVDDLQDVLAAREGRLGLRAVALDFSELVRSTWESVLAPVDGDSCTQHIAPNLRVMADPRLLRKAIEQIFLRARKAAVSGMRMDLSVTAQGEEICLQIKGEQKQPPEARKGPPFDIRVLAGTHVSLLDLLADDVIELHGGRIAAADEGGNPSLWLPCWDDAPRRPAKQQHSTVLVAMNDPDDRQTVAHALELQGYRIMENSEKKPALEVLLQTVPSLVVADAAPAETARQLAEAAREAGYAGRMVAIAPAEAAGQPALDQGAAKRAGFDAWADWNEWQRAIAQGMDHDRH